MALLLIILARFRALTIPNDASFDPQPIHTKRFSAANVQACLDREIEPLIALGREAHHLPLDQRFGPDAPEPETDHPVVRMAWRLKTKAGRAL